MLIETEPPSTKRRTPSEGSKLQDPQKILSAANDQCDLGDVSDSEKCRDGNSLSLFLRYSLPVESLLESSNAEMPKW